MTFCLCNAAMTLQTVGCRLWWTMPSLSANICTDNERNECDGHRAAMLFRLFRLQKGGQKSSLSYTKMGRFLHFYCHIVMKTDIYI